MQIQNTYNQVQTQKSNFGATKIDNVNLLKRLNNNTFAPIKAEFSELNFNDLKDIKLIEKVKEKWKLLTNYGDIICFDFLQKVKNYRYFILEALEEKDKKVTNMVEIGITPSKFFNKKICNVIFLQSAPEIAKQADTTPIKGSGELAMYEVVKLAQKEGCKSVKLVSTANSFYEKIGMKNISKGKMMGQFELKDSKFKNFLDRIAKKYNLE